MIDAPFVERAHVLVNEAARLGLLSEDQRTALAL
jgi:citrate lyase subunit beta/citryl-CoA lyase